MGVPRFFKWLSERYPCVIAPVTDATIPTVHNLYLDMNGIIHNCTQTNTAIRHKIADKELVLRIFQYIDKLFSLIQPTQYFFMAIDGVAPRAKMNQQRQRRYRSAQEAEKVKQDLIKQGEKFPDDGQIFDSNAISPGTEFMASLSKHLQYLVQKKMETDLKWRKCKVILSGHEVPGEGEHKIMEFVRARKMQPNYNPNEVHCLYGLDADLIMLGLSVHEPHFILLREDVFSQTFGKEKKEANKPLVQKFHLLHICALREYLMLEFEELKDKLPFKFEFERIIDDFILICFFCGNDFLPHMPTLDIKEGAITTLLEVYKLMLPQLGGYLTENGRIFFDRVDKFISKFGEHEDRILSHRFALHLKQNKRRRRTKRSTSKADLLLPSSNGGSLFADEALGLLDDTGLTNAPSAEVTKEPESPNTLFSRQRSLSASELKALIDKEESRLSNDAFGATGVDTVIGYSNVLDFAEPISGQYGIDNPLIPLAMEPLEPEEEEEEKDDALADDILMSAQDEDSGAFDFNMWRKNYYQRKMGINVDDPEQMGNVVKAYVEALTWIYNYYYHQCISWKWFYPYHYSPIASDLNGLHEAEKRVNFVLGTPFHPYEQLLGVLPPRSSKLLPVAYNELMLNSNSSISDFYPATFDIDREGTKYEYEGVALLPFIDEQRLLAAVATIDQSRLTADESQRNTFGTNLIFSYEPTLTYHFHSSLPGELPDIDNSHVKVESYEIPKFENRFIPELCPGVKTGLNGLEGFPSLFSKEIIAEPRTIGVCLYAQPSKTPTIVLHLDIEQYKRSHRSYEEEVHHPPADDEARKVGVAEDYLKLLGKKVYIGYPYPRIAYVSSLSDESGSFYEGETNKRPHTGKEVEGFRREVGFHRNVLLRKYGVDIGEVDVLLFVKLFKGMDKTKSGSIVRSFYHDEFAYPAQLLTPNYHPVSDVRFKERGTPPVQQEYAVDSPVIFIGDEYYGASGVVSGHEKGHTPKVVVSLNVAEGKLQPSYPDEMKKCVTSKYFSLKDAASELNVSPRLIGLIIGSIKAELPDGKLAKNNLGLQLRSTKLGKRIVGYAKCEYSSQNLDETYYLNYQTGVPMDKPTNSMFSTTSTFGWQITDKAIELIRAYMNQFPDLFAVLRADDQVEFKAEYLFPDIKDKVKKEKISLEEAKKLYTQRLNTISQWILAQGHLDLPFLSYETDTFTKGLIAEIETASIEFEAQMEKASDKAQPVKVVLPTPSFVYKATDPYPAHLCKRDFYSIGHRVINMASTGHVPFGMRGVIVGIEGEHAQVIFDQEFIGGNLLHGRLNTRRGGICQITSLLNLTKVPRRLMKLQQGAQPQQNTQSNQNAPKFNNNSAPYERHYFNSPQANKAMQVVEKSKKAGPPKPTAKPTENIAAISNQASQLLDSFAKKHAVSDQSSASFDPVAEFQKIRTEDRQKSKYSKSKNGGEHHQPKRQHKQPRNAQPQQPQLQQQPQQPQQPLQQQPQQPMYYGHPTQPFYPPQYMYPPQMGYPPQPYPVMLPPQYYQQPHTMPYIPQHYQQPPTQQGPPPSNSQDNSSNQQ